MVVAAAAVAVVVVMMGVMVVEGPHGSVFECVWVLSELRWRGYDTNGNGKGAGQDPK